MTVDLLDQAFLCAATTPGAGLAHPADDLEQSPITQPGIAADMADMADMLVTAGETAVVPKTAADDSSPGTVDPTLQQLLKQFLSQWAAVATAVEQARQKGARVIAVAGHQQGEGRTTLVRGLALLLAERGWRVACFASASAWWQELVGDAANWQQQRSQTVAGDDLVLVDAGIWFPPGPLRPQQLQLKMFGFDGALLVRRQALPANPARDGAIANAGLRVVGEVVSFAPVPQQRAA